MPFPNQNPQSCRVIETALLDTAGETLFRWSIPSERTYCQFSLVIVNLSDTGTASFSFWESDGDPATDLLAQIGIPQVGGQVPLPATIELATTTLVAGSSTVTCTGSSTTAGIVAGMPVTGTGVPAFTVVLSVTDSTHFVMTQAATTAGTNVVLNVGGLSSPDAVIVGFTQSTTLDNFEGTFTKISGTDTTIPARGQATVYFTTLKHFVGLQSADTSKTRIQIVGSATAPIVNYSHRNSRGAI